MPATNKPTRRQQIFDKLTELRNLSAAAVSATTAETAIEFKAKTFGALQVVINVAAHTGYAAGTAQWEVAIEASADNATFTKVGSYVPTGVLAQMPLVVSGQTIEALVPGASYLRARAVKTGAPGNLTYGAFVTVEK